MSEIHKLDTMFFPDSVAVIGASNSKYGGGNGFLRRLLDDGYHGRIYPINPKASEVMDLKAYPNVKEIPEVVDYVIVAIPAPGVPGVLEDCIAAGIKNIHIFSSGFSETGEEEGRQLDQQITEIIQRGDLNVIGPNCMGLWVPANKFTTWAGESAGPGSVAFLSQSGGHVDVLTPSAQGLGVCFSKIISFGNARGLKVLDFLEYLGQDPDTRIISLYLEGMTDGNRVTHLIKEINRTKPVIVWKSGLTTNGSRAIASHTGSLAGESKIWDAFFAQTGAIRANSLNEIIDVALAFLHLPPLHGRRALLLGGGGGNAVAFADICGRQGLEVPPLSENTRKELNSFIHLAGNSTRNPLDVWMVQHDVKAFHRVLDLSVADPEIDLTIIDRHVGDIYDNKDNDKSKYIRARLKRDREVNDFIKDYAKKTPGNKPLIITMNTFSNDPGSAAAAAEQRREFTAAGIPAYASPQSAARAISRFVKYHEFQAKTAA